jgi:quercetin dioxygenase-like cupin family protein
MQVKRFSEAETYDAPNHRGCAPLRLFGAEAGGTRNLIVGVSHFLPGGGAGPDASPPEKVYFVLAGELTVIAGGKETVLKENDSCFIGPNENREIVNRGNENVLDPGRHRAGAEVMPRAAWPGWSRPSTS